MTAALALGAILILAVGFILGAAWAYGDDRLDDRADRADDRAADLEAAAVRSAGDREALAELAAAIEGRAGYAAAGGGILVKDLRRVLRIAGHD